MCTPRTLTVWGPRVPGQRTFGTPRSIDPTDRFSDPIPGVDHIAVDLSRARTSITTARGLRKSIRRTTTFDRYFCLSTTSRQIPFRIERVRSATVQTITKHLLHAIPLRYVTIKLLIIIDDTHTHLSGYYIPMNVVFYTTKSFERTLAQTCTHAYVIIFALCIIIISVFIQIKILAYKIRTIINIVVLVFFF